MRGVVLDLTGRSLEPLLALLVLADARQDVVDLHVGRLHREPQPVHAPTHLGQFPFDRLPLLALLARRAVHLLIDQAHQVADVGLGKDVLANLIDDEPLEACRVEARGVTGAPSTFQERLADVVGVLAALGLLGAEGLATVLALGQPTEEVGAGGPARVHLRRRFRVQDLRHTLELFPRDDAGEGILDAHGWGAVLRVRSPNDRARVGLVGEEAVDRRLEPVLAVRGGDALVVEGACDVEETDPGGGHLEHAPHDGVRWRIEDQSRAFLGPVLNVRLAVAAGGVGRDPEAARGGLAHPARHFPSAKFAE